MQAVKCQKLTIHDLKTSHSKSQNLRNNHFKKPIAFLY